jgi:hypothetical protein
VSHLQDQVNISQQFIIFWKQVRQLKG